MKADATVEVAVIRSEVADLADAEAAARRTLSRFTWFNALLLGGVTAYAVAVLGATGLVMGALAGVILIGPGWLALRLKYDDARAATRLRQKDLEAALGQSGAPTLPPAGGSAPP